MNSDVRESLIATWQSIFEDILRDSSGESDSHDPDGPAVDEPSGVLNPTELATG
jgi:hypothetical protein